MILFLRSHQGFSFFSLVSVFFLTSSFVIMWKTVTELMPGAFQLDLGFEEEKQDQETTQARCELQRLHMSSTGQCVRACALTTALTRPFQSNSDSLFLNFWCSVLPSSFLLLGLTKASYLNNFHLNLSIKLNFVTRETEWYLESCGLLERCGVTFLRDQA